MKNNYNKKSGILNKLPYFNEVPFTITDEINEKLLKYKSEEHQVKNMSEDVGVIIEILNELVSFINNITINETDPIFEAEKQNLASKTSELNELITLANVNGEEFYTYSKDYIDNIKNTIDSAITDIEDILLLLSAIGNTINLNFFPPSLFSGFAEVENASGSYLEPSIYDINDPSMRVVDGNIELDSGYYQITLELQVTGLTDPDTKFQLSCLTSYGNKPVGSFQPVPLVNTLNPNFAVFSVQGNIPYTGKLNYFFQGIGVMSQIVSMSIERIGDNYE